MAESRDRFCIRVYLKCLIHKWNRSNVMEKDAWYTVGSGANKRIRCRW